MTPRRVHGAGGSPAPSFRSKASLSPFAGQVLFDPCVALPLVAGWMRRDARENGRNAAFCG